MPRKKHNITPEIIEQVRAMYDEVDDNGKKVWSQRRLAKYLRLPRTYISAFVNGFASPHEYRTHLAKKRGFASLTEYRTHLAKEKGFASRHEYQTHLAKENGFPSLTEYQTYLAKEKGFASTHEYRTHLAREKGEEEQFLLKKRLRFSLGDVLKRYTLDGKVQSAREYGIDYSTICESLEEEAKEVHGKTLEDMREEGYHVDHIIPVSFFDLENPEEVRRCYHPSNLRWLPGRENMSRSNRFREEDLEVLVSIPMAVFPEQMMGCGELLQKYPHYFVHTT